MSLASENPPPLCIFLPLSCLVQTSQPHEVGGIADTLLMTWLASGLPCIAAGHFWDLTSLLHNMLANEGLQHFREWSEPQGPVLKMVLEYGLYI